MSAQGAAAQGDRSKYGRHTTLVANATPLGCAKTIGPNAKGSPVPPADPTASPSKKDGQWRGNLRSPNGMANAPAPDLSTLVQTRSPPRPDAARCAEYGARPPTSPLGGYTY